MRTPLKIALVLLVAGLIAATAPLAAGHKLSSEAATRKTEQWAANRCEQIPDCVKSAGRYCYPLDDHHRRCAAQIIRRKPDGDLVQCQTKLFWEIETGSNRLALQRVGKSSCGD